MNEPRDKRTPPLNTLFGTGAESDERGRGRLTAKGQATKAPGT
jgi:hypothetical protein